MKNKATNVVDTLNEVLTKENQLSIVDTPINARALYSLRESGYNNYTAIADIVDNSLDAGVNSKNVFITTSSSKISIADDGCGMSQEELKSALTLGPSTKDSTSCLGKYGLGLNLASTSLGLRVTVITKQKVGDYHIGIYDVDDIVERAAITGKVSIESGEASDAQVLEFKKATKDAKSGTVVIIEKIDNLTELSEKKFQDTLIKELGRIFRVFINDKKNIFINERQVESVDPLALSHPGIIKLGDQIHDINFKNDGEEFHYKIRIKAVFLPAFSDEDKKNKSWLATSPNTQGFYVLRNNREIAKSVTLDAYSKDPHYASLRMEIYLTGDVDKILGLTFNKSQFSRIAKGFSDKIAEETSYYRSAAKKLSSERKSKLSESTEIKNDISEVKTEIDTRFNRMEAIVEDEIKSKKEVKFTADDSVKEKREKQNKETTKREKKNELVEFEFIKNGEHSPVFEPFYMGNKKVKVSLNTDHIFFTEYLSNTDKKSLEVVHKFFLCMARAELKKTVHSEEAAALFEDFRVDFSTELKRLMD